MFSKSTCMVVLILEIIYSFPGVAAYPPEMNNTELPLLAFLFHNHSSEIRPVLNEHEPVTVEFGLMLRQIIDLDEKNQILTANVWIRQFWNNSLLTWDPSHFNDLKKINVEPTRIWRPDILLFNAASINRRVGSLYKLIDTKATISYTGQISWLAPAVITTECKINVRYFPFDEQECPLEFGSWTHDGFRFDIQLFQDFGVDTEGYSENIEWILVQGSGKRHVKMYNCCPEPYPSLVFTIKVRRRAMFYVYNLMIPCGIIALLSLFSFYLPPESGERVSLVITILLAMSVYMLLVTENMPQSADVPLASKFFMAAMCQIALCLAVTCIVIKFHHNKKPMSRFVAFVINELLARLMMMKKCQIKRGAINSFKNSLRPSVLMTRQAHFNPASVELENESAQNNPAANGDVKSNETPQSTTTTTTTSFRDVVLERTNTSKDLDNSLQNVIKELRVLTERVRSKDLVQETQSDWMQAAEVLDRFFMLTFLLTITLTLAFVFGETSNISLK